MENKIKNKLGLNAEEEKQINTICEFLFFDQFSEFATFLRFERCFQPLFSDDQNIELDDLFIELCGPKKKYLNYKRFINSYLKYKDNKVSKGLKNFFDKLFNSILQKDNIVGDFEEGRLTFSTRKANKNRECITLIEVLNDKEGVIHGINLVFDDIFKNKLYPKQLEENLSVGLEISLKILDEEKLEKRGISKYIKASYFRDAVTHVFGTMDEEIGIITFLGFKCVSGKTQFVGIPKGKSFLMGSFGEKMQQFKCQMTVDGITTILLYLDKNHRPNHCLKKKIADLDLDDVSKDETILDEAYLAKLKESNEIEKYITTVLIDDAHFFNFKLKDDIFGNSLKEVIKKKPKKWMAQKIVKKVGPGPKRVFTLKDLMLKFEEEHKKRGRFFRQHRMGFHFDPRFALLSRNRMHRRRRLRPFGFRMGFEQFPYVPFGGFGPKFRRNMLALGPMLPSIRPLSVPPFPPYGSSFMHHPHGGELGPLSYGPHIGHPHFDHPHMSPPPFGYTHYGPPYLFGPYKGYPPIDQPQNFYKNKENNDRRNETRGDRFMGSQNNYENMNYTEGNMRSERQQYFDNSNAILRARPVQKKQEEEEEIPQPQETNNKKEETKDEKKDKEDEEDDDEDILIPDEHPEETTSLEELDDQLASIKKLLENKDLKEERRKLLKLEKLYSQQKNILLDNAEEKEKAELLKKTDIKLDEYIKEEKEKRKEIEEKEHKIIEDELEKNADKKEATIISIVTKPNPEKIFRKQEMYKGKEPWTDPLFQPCKNNLCPCNDSGWLLPENVLFTDVDGWEKYNWSRVEDIVNSKNYQVFEEGISPDDIIQGSIGDCYFLSAIGSLCKFSRYIDKLFFTKEKTKEHLYGVFIYLNGSWKLVLIDDYLPYTGKRFKKFAFSASGGKELWVAFLEKAWAKINGSYAKIGCGGSPTEVFDILTEALSEQVSINPYYKDYIWETMYDSEKKGYIMTAGTSSDIYNLNLDGVGLSAGHAYTVLGVMEIETADGIEKVVRLRNPYGNGEFNGDWSDYSKKWTPELKEKYNLVIKDDGDFYMSYDDFINYYVTLGICKLHPGYKTTSLRMVKPTKCQVAKITVPKGEVHAYLQLYQKNPRVHLKDGTYQKLVYCYLLLVDKDFNYIYSVSNANMHIGIEQTLKEGTYYLLSDVNYRYANPDKRNHSYVVTCYAQTSINIENVTESIDTTKLIQNAIYSYCRQYVPPTPCSNEVFLFRTSTNMDSLPFEAAVFENYTENNYRVKVNVVSKGDKSYSFYEDEIVGEDATSAIKELHVNSVCVFTVLKHSLSSIFTLKYFFAPLKSPNPDSITLKKAPKIYPEISSLKPQEEAPMGENQQTAGQSQKTMDNAQYMPIQDQNNQQYIQEQGYQDNSRYIETQNQITQNNAKNILSQEKEQNMQINEQYTNAQDLEEIHQNKNVQYNPQYEYSQYQNQKMDISQQQCDYSQNQYNQLNQQAISQQIIQKDKYFNQTNTQNNPKKNVKSFTPSKPTVKVKQNTQSTSKINVKNEKYSPKKVQPITAKTNDKKTSQYYTKDDYVRCHIEHVQQNQNKNVKRKIQYVPFSPKPKIVETKTEKKGGNPVFKTQGQYIEENGVLIQYAMINGDTYTIGLENRSDVKVRMQLVLEGLIISSTGRSYAIFYSNPKERKIFNTKILPNFTYKQVGFEFQYI